MPVLFLSALLVLFPVSESIADSKIYVSSEQWARTRSVNSFIGIAGLKKIIERMDKNKSMIIGIHYPGGESGQLWAQQFRNRLVALGVASNRIKLIHGASRENHLGISIGERP